MLCCGQGTAAWVSWQQGKAAKKKKAPDKLGDLAKEVPKEAVNGITWVLLAAAGEINAEENEKTAGSQVDLGFSSSKAQQLLAELRDVKTGRIATSGG